MPLEKKIQIIPEKDKETTGNSADFITETQENVSKEVAGKLDVETIFRKIDLQKFTISVIELIQRFKDYNHNKYKLENNPGPEIIIARDSIGKISELGSDVSELERELSIVGRNAMILFIENQIQVRLGDINNGSGAGRLSDSLSSIEYYINQAKELGFDISQIETGLIPLKIVIRRENLQYELEEIDRAIQDGDFGYIGTADSVIKRALKALDKADDLGIDVQHIKNVLPKLLIDVRIAYVKKLIKEDLEDFIKRTLITANDSDIERVKAKIEETKKAISEAILAGGIVTDLQIKLSELDKKIKLSWAKKLFEPLYIFASREIEKHDIQRFGLRWDLRKDMDNLSKAIISANEAGCDVSEMTTAEPSLFLRLGLKYAKMQVIRFQYFVEDCLMGTYIAYSDILFDVVQAIDGASTDGNDVSELWKEFLELKTGYQKKKGLSAEN